MKTIASLVALAAMAALPGAAQKLPTVDDAGYPKLIAQHKGKVVLVDFWATWCKGCREELPDLVKLEQKLRARGLDVVMISADEPTDQAKAFQVLKEANMAPGFLRQTDDEDKFCQAIDPKWIGALPATFLYNRQGKLARAFIGDTPVKVIEAAIEKLL
ncbi:MAG TPA: TlpA disulfide reductase family protein [Bryobacteraceae bacterium]|nr:TlpA disulfide reductase family protein [Bryobacteraceae bacterium]